MYTLVIALFVVGYALITLEHRLKLNKSLTAAMLGAGLWIVIAIGTGEHVEEALEPIAAETFALVVFLLSAMTLVEVLVHYRFFDFLRMHLFALGLDDRKQLWLISGIAFLLSAIIDNLTTTIVMVQIARRFFGGKNLLLAAGAIVIAANAGGAFSPIGDVTTIMLWLAQKFTALEIIAWAFAPSLTLWFISTFLCVRQLGKSTSDERPSGEERVSLSRSEWAIVTAGFFSFSFPLIAHLVGLPPYIGLLFGIGLVGGLIGLFVNTRTQRESHLSLDIQRLLGRVDVNSLIFFIGILFAVGALEHLGILSAISERLFGDDPAMVRVFMGNVFLGIFSAIVDNIPLTAAAMDIIRSSDPAIWSLLALAVGTGGSLLAIGSAAGVVAMGMVKELTFKAYLHIVSLPAFVGYVAAMIIWCLQYAVFR